MSNASGGKVICAVVLLKNGSEALLQLRDEKPGLTASGLWVFPGGHTNKDEALLTCARREFLEETGYNCENLTWLLSVNDSFISPLPYPLHIFWDIYDPNKTYTCLEGQKIEFIQREIANTIKMPDYLIYIWDLAILAKKAKDQFTAIE